MSKTLRSNSFPHHKRSALPILRRGMLLPLSLVALLGEMNTYLNTAKGDLLQPREQTITAILKAAVNL